MNLNRSVLNTLLIGGLVYQTRLSELYVIILLICAITIAIKYWDSYVVSVPILIFCLSVFISGLILADSAVMLDSFAYLMFFQTLINIRECSLRNFNNLFFVIVLVFFLPLNDSIGYPYSGFFKNSNQLGMAANLLLLLSVFNRKGNYMMFFALMSLVSGSRLAQFVAVLIVFLWLYSKLRKRLRTRSLTLFIMTAATVPLILFSIPVISNTFLEKFSRNIENGDLSNGRLLIVEHVLSNLNLWGNGTDFFHTEWIEGAHNTFFSVVGQYGLIPFLFFVLVHVHGFRRTGALGKYFFVLYILQSMTESMVIKPQMILAFLWYI